MLRYLCFTTIFLKRQLLPCSLHPYVFWCSLCLWLHFPAHPLPPHLQPSWPSSWHPPFHLEWCFSSRHSQDLPSQHCRPELRETSPNYLFQNGILPCFFSLCGISHTWRYVTSAVVCFFIVSLFFVCTGAFSALLTTLSPAPGTQ